MRKCRTTVSVIVLCLTILFSSKALAQNDVRQQDSTTESVLLRRGVIKDTSWQNYASGEFTPGKGFDLVKTKYGSLNISLYAVARYLNQLPGHQIWQDHLGRDREFMGRND